MPTGHVLGRPTLVLPAQEGRTQFLYSAPTDPPKVWIYRKPHGGGSPLSTRELDFDGLGRVSLERRTMADGTISSRATNYNAAGWVRSKTGWATNSATIYRNFDPFGRPTLIQPPDGSAHDVTLTYHGVRQVDRTVKVGTAWNGTAVTESSATTTEIYDRQGRLYQVFEPANPNGSDSTTTYSYDVGSRLARVSQTAKNAAGTSFTQTRLFNYDSRGFLLSERRRRNRISRSRAGRVNRPSRRTGIKAPRIQPGDCLDNEVSSLPSSSPWRRRKQEAPDGSGTSSRSRPD